MHTVCETPSFVRDAQSVGMSAAEIHTLVDFIANNPDAGDEISGTGGCRKLRFARGGKGKSGGYRVITFFTGTDLPVFLLTVFSKGERANLTRAECNALGKLTDILVKDYRRRSRL